MRQTKFDKKHTSQERKNMSDAYKGIRIPKSEVIKLWWKKRKEEQLNGN
jgi:hypothetical protein